MCALVGDKAKKPGNPFAALEALRDRLPKAPPAAAPEPQHRGPARAVVRLERKQRGGKEVTVIEKLALPQKELERWCRELKQALGCGGAVDGEAIVLQGDLRQRLPAVLTARGVVRVTVG
jgi:translation initiation factor 1